MTVVPRLTDMTSKPVLSFSFSKKKEPAQVIVPSDILCTDEDKEKAKVADFVTSITDKQIVSTNPVAEKKELVIPLIQNNNWRLEKLKKKQLEEGNDNVKCNDDAAVPESALTLEEKACRELIREARDFNDQSDDQAKSMSSRVIPIFMANRVPEGYEADEGFDVSVRAENPSQQDYEQVPVEEFGMAMLRGMGFKPEDAKKVPVVDVKIRPKGLGLGAELPAPTKSSSKTSQSSSAIKQEELELKINAQVYVTSGKHKGFYGLVEAFDEDMLQADVRLVIPNMTVVVPVVFLRVVSREEFKKDSKVLNKSSFDDYKRSAEDHQRQDRESSGEDDRHQRKCSTRRESADRRSSRNGADDGDYGNKGVKREEDMESGIGVMRENLSEGDDENGHHHRHDDGHHQLHGKRHPDHHHPPSQKDRSMDRKDGQKFNLHPVKREVIRGGEIEHQQRQRNPHHRPNDSGCWLRSGLRVRFIDRDFRRGKYYNEKVEIIDIVQPGCCTVLTSDRQQLSDITAHMLETVVPRDNGSKVLILKGSHKNEAGILLHRDSKRQEAQVQLLHDPASVLTYHFDHVCEVVRDPDSF